MGDTFGGGDSAASNVSPAVTSASSNRLLWVVVGAVVLSLIIGGFFILGGKSSNGSSGVGSNSGSASSAALVKSLGYINCADILPKSFIEANFESGVTYEEGYTYDLGGYGGDAVQCTISKLDADLRAKFIYPILIQKYSGDPANFESEMISNSGAKKVSNNYLESGFSSFLLTSNGYFVSFNALGPEVTSESKKKIADQLLSTLNNVKPGSASSTAGSAYSGTEGIPFDCAGIAPRSFVDSTFSLKSTVVVENYVKRDLPSLVCNYVSSASILISVSHGSSAEIDAAYAMGLKDFSKLIEKNDVGIKSAEYTSVPNAYLTSYSSHFIFSTLDGYFVSILVTNADSDQSAQTKELAKKVFSNLK